MRIWGTNGQVKEKIGTHLGNVGEIRFLNKIKIVITCTTWGDVTNMWVNNLN
jgi:hypothetical protein